MPFGDPRVLRIDQCDDTFEDLRTAVVNRVRRTTKVEEFLAVGAALADEFLHSGVS